MVWIFAYGCVLFVQNQVSPVGCLVTRNHWWHFDYYELGFFCKICLALKYLSRLVRFWICLLFNYSFRVLLNVIFFNLVTPAFMLGHPYISFLVFLGHQLHLFLWLGRTFPRTFFITLGLKKLVGTANTGSLIVAKTSMFFFVVDWAQSRYEILYFSAIYFVCQFFHVDPGLRCLNLSLSHHMDKGKVTQIMTDHTDIIVQLMPAGEIKNRV